MIARVGWVLLGYLILPFAFRAAPPAAYAVTTRPDIVTRKEWGADESLRSGSPAYASRVTFGVVHHTGNTYLAAENVCRKVRRGGKVFLMIYGVPETRAALEEVNQYEHIAAAVRNLSFEQRKQYLLDKFGADAAHGWFDAVSPRINDRLTSEEIQDLLEELGFTNITRTLDARNHHVVADKLP